MATRFAMADAFRGTLLGGALGDSLGAPFEGSASVSEARVDALLAATTPLRYTDDTHMTIGLADALIEVGHIDTDRLAAVWADNYRAQPWRGYGPGPGQVFSTHEHGVPVVEAAGRLHGGQGSWGNGAAMRVAPVSLLAFDDLDTVARLARETAMITHTHRLGVEGAVLQAIAIAYLLQQPRGSSLDTRRYLETIRSHVGAAEYCQQLDVLPELLPGGDWQERSVGSVLGNGVAAHESVVTALFCFLRHRSDMLACVRSAIGLGGDTDTIAAMAGTLAAAHLGAGVIPDPLLVRLEDAERLEVQAHALLGLARSRIPMRLDAAV